MGTTTKKNTAAVGEFIRAARQERGLTQLELAVAARVQPGTVMLAETGKRITLKTAQKLAPALGTAVTDLIPEVP